MRSKRSTWLARVVDRELADSILGDLEEQRRRRARQSRAGAAIWFWRTAIGVAIYALVHRGMAAARALLSGSSGNGGFGADLRYAVRSLRRAPWYSATVIGVIAIGMMLATTVFAVVDGVLFKPLPFPDADRLVAIEPGFGDLEAVTPPSTPGAAPARVPTVSAVDIANWQTAAPDVALTGFSAAWWSGLGEGVNEEPFGLAQVQPNFFDTLGVHPLAGGLTAADFDHDEIVRPVVITYDLWQTRFHAMADVIGQTFIGDPTKGWGFRVVGVMPRGFLFPSSRAAISFMAPLVPDRKRAQDPTLRNVYEVIARLPPGKTVDVVRASIEAGMAATAATFPARGAKPSAWSDRFWRTQGPFDVAHLLPLSSKLGRAERPLFAAVFLASLVLLALGGLNISALMAARGLDRARELGLRRALGASGLRIARLVFVEALVPILAGALAGLTLAAPLLRLGLRLLPEELVLLQPRTTPAIDVRVVMFVLLTVFALALPTTIWPIRRALRTGAAPLADGARGSTRSRSTGRTIVVAAQVAGALVLTLGGALMVTSILAVYANTPAVRTDGIVVLGEYLLGPGTIMNKSPERTVRMNALIDTLRRVPGVEGVALTDAQVLVGGGESSWFIAPPVAAQSRLKVGVHAVTSDFYRVLQPQLVMGRLPTDAELAVDAPVIVVSESVARTYWPDASPLGQTLTEDRDVVPFAVVGVVKDVRWSQWDDQVASIYGPYARLSRFPFPTVFIRTRLSVGEMTARAVQAIAAVDPLLRTRRAGSFEDLFVDSVRPRRFQSWLFGSFALGALVIVGVGILGMIAMATARRTREMGIRLALGATRDGLVGLLLREQLIGVAAGVILGTLVATWAVRFVKVYLYEIAPYDPRVWAAAVIAIVATAALGTAIPSVRASRVDPVQALRVE